MGASGVVVGTRFLFTHECSFSQGMKDALVVAGHNSTVRSRVYDDVFLPGTPWPAGTDGRCVINNIWKDAEAGLSIEERQKRYAEGKARGDTEYSFIWAGAGVGLTNEIVGAEVSDSREPELFGADVLRFKGAHSFVA
jgi:nitronate monooxygenase